MTTLAKQMYPGRVKFVQEAFADAMSSPYGYILVDLKQDTPEDLRLRTYILPDDDVQYVYMPKSIVVLLVHTASLLIPRCLSARRVCTGITLNCARRKVSKLSSWVNYARLPTIV